ncbi:MAG TPA: hypothetical protein VEC60_20110 [Reyranella sp.]|nr:hypothetical protein [Reyranella sp.]
MEGKRAMRWWPIALVAAAAACADYPRDIDGTLDRIRESRVLRVGATLAPDDVDLAQDYVSRLERATGARATMSAGPAEQQIALLEAGELDLVIGDFAEDSPWLTEVAVIEPLNERVVGDRMVGLAPVAANGENRWIMLLEREVRNLRAGGKR